LAAAIFDFSSIASFNPDPNPIRRAAPATLCRFVGAFRSKNYDLTNSHYDLWQIGNIPRTQPLTTPA
jgi:hypothetical protein